MFRSFVSEDRDGVLHTGRLTNLTITDVNMTPDGKKEYFIERLQHILEGWAEDINARLIYNVKKANLMKTHSGKTIDVTKILGELPRAEINTVFARQLYVWRYKNWGDFHIDPSTVVTMIEGFFRKILLYRDIMAVVNRDFESDGLNDIQLKSLAHYATMTMECGAYLSLLVPEVPSLLVIYNNAVQGKRLDGPIPVGVKSRVSKSGV